MKTSTPVPSHLPLGAISPRVAVWSSLTGIAIALPAIYLVHLFLLPPASAAIAADQSARVARILLDPWPLVLKALIIYPLLEEAFYRGLILQMLRRYTPAWFAVLVPTSLFAFTHIGSGMANVAFAFVVGLYLSWLVIGSRSLWSSILCHSAINLAVVFVFSSIFNPPAMTSLDPMMQPLPLLFLAGSLVLAASGIRILRCEFNHRPAAVPAESSPCSPAAVTS